MSRARIASLAKSLGGLSPRDRRALVLGGLLLVAALGFRFVALPYTRALADVRDRVERERDLLRREGALLADAQAYATRFERSEAVLLREAPRLFSAQDLVAATGALSNYVSDQAIRNRVFVQHSETRPPEVVADGIAKLQVDLRAVGDLEGLLSLLQSLETGAKLVTVERILVTPAAKITAGAPRDEEVLGIVATVAGYALSAP